MGWWNCTKTEQWEEFKGENESEEAGEEAVSLRYRHCFIDRLWRGKD